MRDPLMNISGLSFAYKQKRILDGISLEVGKGEMILFAGANGAGKTTLLNLMAGILPCPEGTISPRLELEKTAHIDSDLSLYKSMPAAEAEGLHRSLFRCGPVDWQALNRIGIESKTRLGGLSRGQKAMFRLHLALAQQPQLLMIDEVLVSLDPLFQEEMGNLLVDLCEGGATVIAVSQTPGDWQHLYTRLWLLKGTHLIIDQPIDELLAQTTMEHQETPTHPEWPILDQIHRDGLHQIVYHPLPRGSNPHLEPVSLQQFVKSTLRSEAC